MSLLGRLLCVIGALVCVAVLERYARVGEDLTDNGKKLIRLVYCFVAGVLLVAAIFG